MHQTTLSDLSDLCLAWVEMVSVVELKVGASRQSQLLNYLKAICCHWPDLVSVVAISSKLGGNHRK